MRSEKIVPDVRRTVFSGVSQGESVVCLTDFSEKIGATHLLQIFHIYKRV
jgi:hypothetical protein